MRNIIGIFGTSGFSRETADVADSLGFKSIFIARDKGEIDSWNFPEDVILESSIERLRDIKFIIGIGENTIRRKLVMRFSNSLDFVNLIHPDASFGKRQKDYFEAKIGVIICAGVRFTNNIKVGDFSIFNLNSTVGHDSIIEDFVNVAPGANISGHVHIKNGCWVGSGAVINQGVSDAKLVIGENTTIGSGSVVVRNCDSNSVYVGIPAKRMK